MRIVVMFFSRFIIGLSIVLSLSCTNMMDEAFNEAIRKDKNQAKVALLHGVYEVRGLIVNEQKLIESSGDAAFVPHLVLNVVKVSKIAADDGGKFIRVKGEQEFLELEWRQIKNSWRGVYGINEPLKSFLNKKVRINGSIYDQCGNGLYLSEEGDETHCGYIFNPVNPTHIELRNFTGDDLKIGKP